MILVDDLLLKPFVSLLDILHAVVLNELHDVGTIRDEIEETSCRTSSASSRSPSTRPRSRS
jgi:hypothetical protein